jgi:microcystin-dependent protein
MSTGAAVPGTIVPSGAQVSPGGAQGQGGQAGSLGPAGPQGVSGDSLPIGAVYAYTSLTAPSGSVLCDGTAYSRTLYSALFGVIGTTFGSGDGITTFNVPDLRSRFILGVGQGTGLANRVLAATGGEENHQLTVAELAVHAHGVGDPTHNHSQAAHAHGIGDGGHVHGAAGYSSINYGTGGGLSFFQATSANTSSAGTGISVAAATAGNNASGTGVSVQNTGSGNAHNNMPPFMCLVYVIKVSIGGGPSAQAPIANTTQAGLVNALSGRASDYIGGDNACHPSPAVLRGYISGFTLANSTPAATMLAIGPGMATDASVSTLIISNGAFNKSISGAWAAGSGSNGMGTGLTVAASTWYHVFAIINAGAFDVYFDTSATGVNAPAGTTALRRLGSIKTNASSQILAFSQLGDEFLWIANVVEKTALTVNATNQVIALIGVPTGIQVRALLQVYASSMSGSFSTATLLVTSLDTGTQVIDTPGVINRNAQIYIVGATNVVGYVTQMSVRTSSSAQVQAVSTTASPASIYLTSMGWIDPRGKD